MRPTHVKVNNMMRRMQSNVFTLVTGAGSIAGMGTNGMLSL